MASLSGVYNAQNFTNIGALMVGGRLYTYSAGTTTHKVAYTDAAAAVPHTYTSDGIGGQYIALDARGELPAPLFLTSGSYDIALKTSAGATVWTRRAAGQSDAAETLQTNLASSASSSVGAGMIGWIRSATGAVATTVYRWMQRTAATAFDFMNQTLIDDVQARTALVSSTTALQALLDSRTMAVAGSIELELPDGKYLISGSGTNILTVQGGTKLAGGSLEGTILYVAGGSTATVAVGDNGTAAKTELSNVTIYGNSNAALLSGLKLGFTTQFGTYGTLDNIMVRDMPNATAYALDVNIAVCGKLYSMNTANGLMMDDAGSGLRVEAFTPLGISATGLSMCAGSSVGFYEFEGPTNDNAKAIVFSRGGSVENFIFSVGTGRTIKTPVEIDDTYVDDYYIGPTTIFTAGTGTWGDVAATTTGTTTAVGTRSFTDTSKSFRVDQFKGGKLILTSGPYSGDRYDIEQCDDSTVYIKGSAWTVGRVPGVGVTYVLDYFIKKTGGGGYAHCDSGSQYQYVGHNLSITNEARINALTAGLCGTPGKAPTLTISANVITPTRPISFLGAGLVKTITAPALFSIGGGSIRIIPTAAFTWDATANIAVAGTAVVSRVVEFVYDSVTTKWYPSYV